MDGLKESKQAVGAATLAAVNNLAPPTILAQASRLNFSTRLFNLIVTNIPGPQLPLYVLGRELEDLFPVAFLPENHALAIAIMSYNGGIDYGLLGDYDALPDIDVIAEGIDEALQELLAIASGDDRPAPGRRPARSRSRTSTRTAETGATPTASAAAHGRARGAEEPVLPLPSARVKTRSGRRHARQAQPAALAPPEPAPVVLARRAAERGTRVCTRTGLASWLPALSTATVAEHVSVAGTRAELQRVVASCAPAGACVRR